MFAMLLLGLMADPTPIVPAKLDRKTPVDYATEIRPIFAAKCNVCHAGKIAEGDYDISTPALAIKGGKRGAAIVVQKPDDSLLLKFSAHRQKPIMPPKTEDNPLTPMEVALIERWIREGAKGEAEVMKTEVTLRSPTIAPVRGLAIDPKKSWVAIARGADVALFDAKNGERVKSFASGTKTSHVSLIESLALSPDGQTLATGSFREVKLWDVASGRLRHTVMGFAHAVVSLAFRPDGKQLATGGGVPSEDGEVKWIDVATGKVTGELKQPHTDTVYGLAYHPEGKQLATASADKFVKLFDVSNGKLTGSFEGHTQHVLDVAWTADGKRIISGGADGLMKIWDVEKGEKVRDIPGFGKQVTRMARQGPTCFTAAGDGSVKSINPETGGTNKSFAVGSGFLSAVATSVDGEWLIAGGDDGMVKLWDVKSGRLLREWTR